MASILPAVENPGRQTGTMSSSPPPPPKRSESCDDGDELRQLCWPKRPRIDPTGTMNANDWFESTIDDSEDSWDSRCDSNCDCQQEISSDSNFSEYEVRNSSSSYHYMDTNLSDSSTSLTYKAEKNNKICDETFSNDNGYLPNDSDIQITKAIIPRTHLSLPARFKTCVQCRKQNANPYFQYCSLCFKFRMEYYENKPNCKRKQIGHTREGNVLKDSPESTFGLSCEYLSQKNNFNSIDIEASKTEVDENSYNLCNICLTKPKNGVFNHGKIGHVYCCYTCAKLLWKKSNKCPLCNTKIKFVTKMITE